MKLYELNHLIDEILENDFIIDEETGEITMDVDSLDQLEMERNEKIENIGCFIKDQDAFIEALKAEKRNLDKKIKVATNKIEWLKAYTNKCLDGEKFQSPRVSISYRKSESVEVDEARIGELPEEYKRTKITVEADKTELKKALKDGAVIDGVQLVIKNNIQIK